MTQSNPFSPVGGGGTAGAGYFDIRIRQGNPLIVKVWDNPEYVRTANNPDGMVYIRDKDAFPNRCVRAAIVDLNATAPDGSQGILYPESWIQASSLMKEAKKWIDQGIKLVRWDQTGPRDGFGAPDKSAPYAITDLMGDQAAVAQAMAWMAAHPEFNDLKAPAPYDGKPPAPKVPQTQQDPWAQGPQQPYYGQQPGPYGQQPPQSWQPPVPPQQPPAAWNTAAPPPEYYQQTPQWVQQQQAQQAPVNPQYPQQQYQAPAVSGTWGSPSQVPVGPPQQPQQPYGGPPAQQGPPQQQHQQQAPQGPGGSFFAASQGQQAPQVPQWQGGFDQQSDSPPF